MAAVSLSAYEADQRGLSYRLLDDTMTRRGEELPGLNNLAIKGTPLFTAPVDSISEKGDLATTGRRFFSSIGLAVLVPES